MSEKGSSNIHEWVKGNVPIVIALLLTCLVVAIAASLGHGRVPLLLEGGERAPVVSRWDWFFELPPNAMGDTLAGLLGALTLIWVIASVFHQSKELADQREIMREQKREFELMVEAQNAQVRALEAQSAILKDERARRNEDRMKEVLDGLLNTLRGFLQNNFSGNCYWTYVIEVHSDGHENIRKTVIFSNAETRKASIDLPEMEFFQQMRVRLQGILTIVSHHEEKNTIREKPSQSSFEVLVQTVDYISQSREKLSLGQHHRLAAIGFEPLKAVILALAAKATPEDPDVVQ